MKALTVICLLLIALPGVATEPIHRVAVFDFENLTNDETLNWFGVALADSVKVAIGRAPEFTTVERKVLDRVLQERALNRSPLVDAKTTPPRKPIATADAILRGTFQKAGNDLRVTVEVVNVDTLEVRATVSVTGTVLGLIKLENDLAARLMIEMKGTLVRLPPRVTNVQAIQAFSDGLYFYHHNLAKDALPFFDQALKLVPNYPDAHFYKGVVLEEMQRWDDAIAEFKLALPHSAPERIVLWNYEVPFTADGSKRGMNIGMNPAEFSYQALVWTPARTHLLNNAVYGERRGKNTVLYFVDFIQRGVRPVELPDSKINLNSATIITDRVAFPASIDNTNRQLPATMKVWAVGLNTGSIWWNTDLNDFGEVIPLMGTTSKLAYIYYGNSGRLIIFDDQTQRTPYPARDGLELEKLVTPKSRFTKTNGEVLIGKTPQTVLAIRLSDGKDAWTVRPEDADFTHIVADDTVVIFEPAHRILVIDIENGTTRQNIPIPQFADNLPMGVHGSVRIVGAKVDRNILYFLSKSLDLYAYKLDGGKLWDYPVKQQINSLNVSGERVYAGTDSGEIVIVDVNSGKLVGREKITTDKLVVHYAGPDVIVAWSDRSVYGLEPATGKRRWDVKVSIKEKMLSVIHGVVVTRTSETEISAIDGKTGKVLWPYSSKQIRSILNVNDALFIVEGTGVKEFAVSTSDEAPSSTDREVLTELGNALVSKGSVAEAQTIADKVARDIDPNYPPLHALRARIEKTKGNVAAAAKELAAYAALVGPDSREGQDAQAELKKDYSFLWRDPLDTDPVGKPVLVGDTLISIGNSAESGKGIVALNAVDGTIRWRQPTNSFSDSVIDEATGRAWMVTRDETDASVIVLYSMSLEIGTRKELARWSVSFPPGYVSIAYANDRLFVASLAVAAQTVKARVDIHAFTATGSELWKNTEEGPIPFSFLAHNDHLIMSLGKELRIFTGANGAVHEVHEEEGIAYRLAVDDSGTLYAITGKQQLVRYNIATATVTSRAALPAFDFQYFTYFIRDNTLIGTDTHFILAFDLAKSKEAWRLPAAKDQQFLAILPADKRLIALRNDQTLLHVDPDTGKVLAEQPALWRPASLNVFGDKLYAFTTDRAVFAIQLKP